MFSAEIFRKLEGIVHIGLIAEIDHKNKQLRIIHESEEDDELTAWLPWPAEVGRNFARWRPLKKGIQVVLLCESGDLANAVIVAFLYTEELGITSPSVDPNIDIIQFNDGTIIQYDSSQGALSVSATNQLSLSAKTLNLSAETLNITSSKTNWIGSVSHSLGEFISNLIPFSSHKHKENGEENYTDGPSNI